MHITDEQGHPGFEDARPQAHVEDAEPRTPDGSICLDELLRNKSFSAQILSGVSVISKGFSGVAKLEHAMALTEELCALLQTLVDTISAPLHAGSLPSCAYLSSLFSDRSRSTYFLSNGDR